VERARSGSRRHIAAADLSDPTAPDALIAAATEAAGGVDILINNAGLTRDNLAMRMKDEEWQQVLDVNLSAAFRLSRAVLRRMMKARWGRIVSITSVVAATGNPGQVNYAASKAGLTGMTKALAQEVASRGITVNCIAPGFIETPMTDVLSDDQKSTLLERIPVGRLGLPEDISASTAYLVSDEAGYVTGQTLHVNGGMAML
jgi:3-oxoacyl-[acyl-carrier protein] reductase